MGKRSDFIRVERDFYPTPEKAVLPLLPHLPPEFTFCEPCAGDGRLIDHIEKLSGGNCIEAFDLEPQREDISQRNALFLKETEADLVISNTPWNRKIFHPLIEVLSDLKPTWLLHDSDWLFTKQAAPYLPRIRKIVTIGRVSWMENGVSGKDNCVWTLFQRDLEEPMEFFGRAA